MGFGVGGWGIGDWGLGIGEWGLGPIPKHQFPIPNPQSPISKILYKMNIYFLFKFEFIFYKCQEI